MDRWTQKSFVHCLRFIITELQAQTFKLGPASLLNLPILSLQHSKVNDFMSYRYSDTAAAQAVAMDSKIKQ